MLPLDRFDEKINAFLIDHGADPEQMNVAVKLKRDLREKREPFWFSLNAEKREWYIFSPSDGSFTVFSLDEYVDPELEVFRSSCRLIAYRKTGGDGEKEESRESVILFTSTLKGQPRILAMIQLTKRLLDGEEILDVDPIFEQFHLYCPNCGTPYPDEMTSTDGSHFCPRCSNKGRTVLRMMKYYKPQIFALLMVLFCQACSALVVLILPQIQGNFLYNQVLDPKGGPYHNMTGVLLVVLLSAGLALFRKFVEIGQYIFTTKIGNEVEGQMKKDLFEKMQSLPLSFFGKHPAGTLIHRINNDAPALSNFMRGSIPPLVFYGGTFIAMSIFLLLMNWKLALFVLVPVPFLILFFKFKLPTMNKMYGRNWHANSKLNRLANDTLTGMRVVKAFAKEVDESHRFHLVSETLADTQIKTNLVYLTIFPLATYLIGLASDLVWGTGGLMVMGKAMTYGEFVTFLGYVGMAFAPLQFFATFSNTVTSTMTSGRYYFEIMDTNPDFATPEKPADLKEITGDIEFRNVNFSYNIARPILKGVSFKIDPGDQVGLVGHTGAGKTTIANLITRLYDVSSGEILLNGVNIKKVDPDLIRRSFAVVSQEIFIFRGTIADNIRYGCPEATMDQVIEAAKGANAHDFIMDLPFGYETSIGRGNRSLSGGQQQRISIARALLTNPSVLILDEATAAMDTETERSIEKALERLTEGKTTISIAHRLSTLKNCNKLYVIEKGKVAEQGTHMELIHKKGIYYKLYKLQSEANTMIKMGE